MDSQTHDTILQAIAQATMRLHERRETHLKLESEMVRLNQQGVAVEKEILGIEGELRALQALVAPVSPIHAVPDLPVKEA